MTHVQTGSQIEKLRGDFAQQMEEQEKKIEAEFAKGDDQISQH